MTYSNRCLGFDVTDLVQIKKDDGSWDNLVVEWKAQCESFNEEYEQFAMASLPVLADCAGSTDISEGVFALTENHLRISASEMAGTGAMPNSLVVFKIQQIGRFALSGPLTFGLN
jgi:hypothetical protein